MDAIENILGRRSIRKYKDKPVPKEIVRSLLEAGMNAPTARNIQPWHFVVVDDRIMLDKLGEAHPYAKMLRQATLAILVCGDRRLQEMDGYLVQDCSAATQNIMLAAHAHGLGSVWLGMYPREERMKDVGSLLGIPGHILPVALISIGYPDEYKPAPDRYKEERIHRNKF
ncbi:MAG TPA: nitroreductase family protein [Bacteroidales bacterium]|nr:nitroreductase family protein [Bacteroidales bacterium]